MTTGFVPEPEWLRTATGQMPTILDLWDGVPSLFLAPTKSGAILWWQFDQGDDASDYILLTHLTDSEAQTVFETRAGEPLADVRRYQHDNRALILRRHTSSGFESVHLFALPRDYDEARFTYWLQSIAEVLAEEQIPAAQKHFGVVEHGHWASQRRDPRSEAIDRLAASAVPV